MEQEKRKKATKTQGGKAAMFLAMFLKGEGEVLRDEVFEAADKAGPSKKSVYAAKAELGERIVVRRLPTTPSRTVWQYPDAEPY